MIVGAETVLHDNPKLTTRRVAGRHAVCVILDPRGRLADDYDALNDEAVSTLLVTGADVRAAGPSVGQAETLSFPRAAASGELKLESLLTLLHRRGLKRLFIEGGSVTVSRLLICLVEQPSGSGKICKE